MSELIVFDLDGTLIDSRRDIAQAINLMRRELQLAPLPEAEVVSYVGNGAPLLVERSLAGTDLDRALGLQLMKKFYAKHLIDYTTLYPGVETGLRQLFERGIPLAVVSNKPSALSEAIVRELGIAPYFKQVIGGDSPLPLKPEPDILLDLAQKLQVNPRQSWMVGDHYTDLAAGRRAQFQTALASWGFGDPRPEIPDFTAQNFAELVQKII